MGHSLEGHDDLSWSQVQGPLLYKATSERTDRRRRNARYRSKTKAPSIDRHASSSRTRPMIETRRPTIHFTLCNAISFSCCPAFVQSIIKYLYKPLTQSPERTRNRETGLSGRLRLSYQGLVPLIERPSSWPQRLLLLI